MSTPSNDLPTVEHLGFLEDLSELPAWLHPDHRPGPPPVDHYSCAFCGVGDGAAVQIKPGKDGDAPATTPAGGEGTIEFERFGHPVRLPARLRETTRLEVDTPIPLTAAGGVLSATLVHGTSARPILLRDAGLIAGADGVTRAQTFAVFAPGVSVSRSVFAEPRPTTGCLKFKISLGQQKPVFPIHVAPSVLDATGRRHRLSYEEGVTRLSDLLLAHCPPRGRTLVYACGQIDYFTVFAFQEVFRLLGVRNLAGNAEHCLNAGAVHNEILTGQEGPFLTLEGAFDGPDRVFLLNGWNGLITHPPAFARLMGKLHQGAAEAWLVEVAVTESAKMLAAKVGADRVLLIRSGGDPHLALAIAHEVFARHPQAVSERFLGRFADRASFDRYRTLAASERFAPAAVAERIAPEPKYAERLLRGIREIAARLARPETVPINLPSVGLSQTKGAVSHCLWGSLLALLGRYGLRADGSPAGGTLRIPGQINAQTEVQGLSRRAFMGRIPVTEEGAREAARRMGLPDDAYATALAEPARAALDYSDDAEPGKPELFLFFGTQFESNMPGRLRWIRKLESAGTTFVAVDPIPDPFSLRRAALVLPSPPHAAAAKLYQNGEWRLTLSVPRKRAGRDTRTDATLVYDAMAEISRRLREDASLRAAHPDLARHADSGYLRARFESPEHGGGLPRFDGEVSRPSLWRRILDYYAAGEGRTGAVYCRPEHADGREVSWRDLVDQGSVVYGGVGSTRFRLDYDDPAHEPFRDVYRRPRKFVFFVPTEKDLELPGGIILNSGRSTMSDDKRRVRFAIATFNSGKATPAEDMPDENPLHVSQVLAERLGLVENDRVRVTNAETGASQVLRVVPTDRLKGDAVYASFHKSRAEIDEGRYLNDLTSHTGRCPYTSQSNFKSTVVTLEKVSG